MKQLRNAFVIVFTAFVGMLMFGRDGHAYIDPSVMTYLIQAIAGVVIAVGAIFGIYWRKARKKVNKALGVDENRNKTVETDNIVIDEDLQEPEDKITETKAE